MLPTISNPMVRNIFRNIDCDITLPLNNGCDKGIDFDFGEKPTGNEVCPSILTTLTSPFLAVIIGIIWIFKV